MKTVRPAASLGLAALLLAAASPPQALTLPHRNSTNILGNGGCESWYKGNGFQSPLGPDLWHAMGDTSDVFTQGDIAFTRVAGCPPASNGSFAMQMRANLPGNFVSQSVENFGEYAGRDVTFSISARPLFSLANARIEVDDGVSTTTELIKVSMGQWGDVTVCHTVSECPTKLEFKIYPEQTIDVDEAMAVEGRQAKAAFVPRPNPEPGLQEVPLGTVLDWFRFDASIPVPEGFAICDGALVSDPASTFVGRATPNLKDLFVRGVTNVGSIGSVGGSPTINLAHTHSINHGHTEDFGPFYAIAPCCSPFPAINVDSFSGSSGSALSNNVSILPPYFGLLKIVRIK